MAPVAVALFEAQRVEREVAAQFEAVRIPRLSERVPEDHGIGGGNIELPTEFAHVTHPVGEDFDSGDLDALVRGEWECVVTHVGTGQRPDEVASVGTHDRDTCVLFGHVGDRRVLSNNCASQRVEVALASACSADDPEGVLRDTADGQVGFDAAMVVQPLGVNRCADVGVDSACGEVVQDVASVGARHLELGEGREVEHANRFANSGVFDGVGPVPALDAPRVVEGVRDRWSEVRLGVVHRPVPSVEVGEVGASIGGAVVER